MSPRRLLLLLRPLPRWRRNNIHIRSGDWVRLIWRERCGKKFKDLSGQEILALAISSEETDARIYADFAAGLKAKASVLKSKREDMVNAGLFPVARMKQLMIEAGLVVETVIFWSIALPGALLVLAVELLWENLVGFKIAGHLSASH